MEWLRLKWSYDNCLAVDNIERRGGLALLWNTEVQLEVSFSLFHIDIARVTEDRVAGAWRFTGFHGTQTRYEEGL